MTARAIAAMKYQLTQHGFKIKYDRPVNSLHVHADPAAAVQAITNLIANSIKYSGETKYIEISLLRKDSWALCRVRDRGCGISSEALPHLFERFYRDPAHARQVEGVGIGLPLVKHIMDAHGGRVHVTSKPGKGSEFTLSFPLKKSNHESQKKNSGRRG
jgi:two-component system phosphate regulon sensor histidine kinase PhoR